jgi:hypothetical protein
MSGLAIILGISQGLLPDRIACVLAVILCSKRGHVREQLSEQPQGMHLMSGPSKEKIAGARILGISLLRKSVSEEPIATEVGTAFGGRRAGTRSNAKGAGMPRTSKDRWRQGQRLTRNLCTSLRWGGSKYS